jgi:hypothetical protein
VLILIKSASQLKASWLSAVAVLVVDCAGAAFAGVTGKPCACSTPTLLRAIPAPKIPAKIAFFPLPTLPPSAKTRDFSRDNRFAGKVLHTNMQG